MPDRRYAFRYLWKSPGFTAAVAIARGIRAMLFVVLAVVGLASFIPARRAASVAPLLLLRD